MMLALVLASSLPALANGERAGSVGGNGGFVYVCNGKPELIDLKEIAHIPYLNERIQIVQEDISHKEQVEKRLKIIEKISPKLAKEVKETIQRISGGLQQRRVLDTVTPNDLGYIPTIPGCKVTNVITYTRGENFRDLILVNSELYNKLPVFHQVALLFHEALYKIARTANITYGDLDTSLPIRRFVAALFSSNVQDNMSFLKEITKYYIENFGRASARKVTFRLCFDSKYLEKGGDRVELGRRFFKKLRMSINQRTSDFMEFVGKKDLYDFYRESEYGHFWR